MQTILISKAIIKFWYKFQIQILGYSFTRNHGFFVPPRLFPSALEVVKLPNFFPSTHTPLNTSKTALVCIIFSILNCS